VIQTVAVLWAADKSDASSACLLMDGTRVVATSFSNGPFGELGGEQAACPVGVFVCCSPYWQILSAAPLVWASV